MQAQLLAAILGVWLMAAPAVLGYGEPAATSDRVVGPLAASFAVVAVWQVTRPVRWGNLPLGVWLLAAPWLLGYERAAFLNSMAVGAALVACALVRGTVDSRRLGGGWSALRNPGNTAEQHR